MANDTRFTALGRDPKYRLPSTKNARVQVDNRFSRMFKDEDFNKKAKVDRYGRKLSKGDDSKVLKRLYRADEEAQNDSKAIEKTKMQIGADSDAETSDEVDADEDIEAELDRMNGTRDLAREGFDESSSDDSSSEDEDDLEAAEVEAELPDQQQDVEVPLGDASVRLAVVNLDWDNIRAVDIYAVAQSFSPSGTGIVNVKVYPSEFGKERIEREALDGPPREIFATSKRKEETIIEGNDSDDSDARIKDHLLQADDGKEFDSAGLRAYQLQRLRYYYAVITCDSITVSKALYEAMDGREYLSTANFFDMRFVPDEVSFDGDDPRDECTQIPSGYKPNDFVTDALTHSKVKLTWDNDDTTRKEVQKRAFSRAEIDENDIQAYIGGDSSDESGASDAETAAETKKSKAEAQRAKMRAALGLSDEPTKTKKQDGLSGDMQITFTSGLSSSKEKEGGNTVFENEPIKDETTLEKYVRKEKERKARRKEKSKANRAGTEVEPETDVGAEPQHEADLTIEEPATNEDPFDDPFFADPDASLKHDRAAERKASKAKSRAARKEADETAARERAELEKNVMTADDKSDAMRHFDMQEIRRAEKREKNAGRLKQRKRDRMIDLDETGTGLGRDRDGRVGQDGFEVETADPRFKGLFESHEYAIDPTNPRFSGTKGMKALLEEGRRKRKVAADVPVTQDKRAKKSQKADGLDVKRLVAKVKGRTM